MKTRKNRLKGSVLFTVVSVMALLIIFMMSTLLLSTAASRRSHANYSESQAEYTARAAIESFAQAMNRNAAVAQSVVNMSKNDVLTPTVVINDAGMGSVGYYDATNHWIDDKIQIEYVDDMYVYNSTSKKWESQQVLRVLATAKIGKEERTVAQYIRKKAPSEPKPVNIKGFQTINATIIPTGGSVTGAFCVGIDGDEGEFQDTAGSNQVKWATDITFINGNYKAGTRLNIDVNEDGTGTVIMGDLQLSNGMNIDINYAYATDSGGVWSYDTLTQTKIPYLYVDGKLYGTDSTNFYVNNIADSTDKLRDGSPYNIFLGSADIAKQHFYFHSSDLYLMDDDASRTSYLGTSAFKANLYAWSDSIANGTATQFYSEGGNIFCNHNLEIGAGEIYGDVRVNGNLTLAGMHANDLKIHGDLVVKGDLIIKDSQNFDASQIPNYVDGTIYIGGNSPITDGEVQRIRSDLVAIENHSVNNVATDELKSGYTRLENKIHYYVSHTNFYWDDGNMYYYYDLNDDGNADDWNPVGKVGEVDPPYCYMPVDKDGNEYTEQWKKTTEPYSYFDQWGNSKSAAEACKFVVADKDGNATSEETEEATTIYVKLPDGTVTDERTTDVASYYKDNGDGTYTRVTGDEVYETSDAYKLYAEYGQPAYPANMTKEAILGQTEGGKYKIVTTLSEVRESVGYKTTYDADGNPTSALDSNTYKTDVTGGSYDSGTTYKNTFAKIDLNQFGVWNITGADTKKEDNASKSYEGKYFVVTCSGISNNCVVNVNPNGKDIWVVLDNCDFAQAVNFVVGTSGSVIFLIRGTVNFGNGGGIFPISVYNGSTSGKVNVKNNITVNETDSSNITYYGTNPSTLKASNEKLFYGTALCPYTNIDWNSATANSLSVTYVTASGESQSHNNANQNVPCWVGNCLFGEMNESCNDFTLLYTGNASTGTGESIDNSLLKESWSVMYYDVY